MVVVMERFGATGGASSSPTKSGWDSAVLERVGAGLRFYYSTKMTMEEYNIPKSV